MPPLVSLITPTHRRDLLLPQTLRWVRAQTYPALEWLVLDDSPQPSRSLAGLDDPRVRYQHVDRRLTIGEKRNRLAAAARGEFIVHFDDDDYYAPRYVEALVSMLETHRGDFAHLSSWYLYDLRHDFFGFWNLRQTTGIHYACERDRLIVTNFAEDSAHAQARDNYLGYGFTYAYRRRVWEANPFPDQDWGEDGVFVSAVSARHQILSIHDETGLVLHVLHAQSSSACFPQFHLPTFVVPALFAAPWEGLQTLRPARGELNPPASGR